MKIEDNMMPGGKFAAEIEFGNLGWDGKGSDSALLHGSWTALTRGESMASWNEYKKNESEEERKMREDSINDPYCTVRPHKTMLSISLQDGSDNVRKWRKGMFREDVERMFSEGASECDALSDEIARFLKGLRWRNIQKVRITEMEQNPVRQTCMMSLSKG